MVRKIDISSDDGPDRITMMVGGHSRSGKTEFAGTFPRPVFLADASEGGYTTLQHMPDEKFYEPGRLPEVYAITSAKDMIDAIMELEQRLKQDKNSFGTIVIDSITFYADMALNDMELAPDAPKDRRQIYGELARSLRYIMLRVHKMPVNVIWIALAKEGGEDHALGGISIPGQTATKAPARCDIWSYMVQMTRNKGLKFEMHFQTYGGFKAGHRFGTMLPAKLENATFRDLEKHLELRPWTDRLNTKAKTKPKPARAAAR